MNDENQPTAESSSTLQTITSGLVEELQTRYDALQVTRNGALQITLFRQVDYRYAQIVVGERGICFVANPTKDVPDEEIERNVFGPYALEDPRMFTHLFGAIDQWLKLQQV